MISIVIPIYNEEKLIDELWRRLVRVISTQPEDFEVVIIDDGSTDNSLDILLALQKQHESIKIVRLSRNFGHQQAITAGLDQAIGDAVIMMDGDLQDDPEDIQKFMEYWRDGYEVVYAVRTKRKESVVKKLLYSSFYRFQNWQSSVEIPLDAGVFSLIDRRVVDVLKKMPERNRYVPGLRAFVGFKQRGVELEREARYAGRPRVGLRRLLRLAGDGVFAFSTLPLRFASIVGALISVSAFVVGTYALISRYVFGERVLSWDFGLTTVMFLFGVVLITLGIIGEYIARIYEEVKHRPYYIVEAIYKAEKTNEREHS